MAITHQALKRLSTRLLAAALVGALVLPVVATGSAEAGDRRHGWNQRHGGWNGNHGRHGGWNGNHGRPRHDHYRGRDNSGDVAGAIALGVLGLAAGAAIASAASGPDYIDPPYAGPGGYVPDDDTYIDPAHRGTGFRKPYYPDAPTVVTGQLEPWTSEWYAYCADRYRSFDARSGTFTTYSGEKRFCQ